MLKFLLASAVAISLTAAPAFAQNMQAAPSAEPPKAKAAKPLSPKQQKNAECRAKWKEEKKTSKAKGRAAYQSFMKNCTTARSASPNSLQSVSTIRASASPSGS